MVSDERVWRAGSTERLGVPVVLDVALWSVGGIVCTLGTLGWDRGLPVGFDAIALCRLLAVCEHAWDVFGLVESCVFGALVWLGSV